MGCVAHDGKDSMYENAYFVCDDVVWSLFVRIGSAGLWSVWTGL